MILSRYQGETKCIPTTSKILIPYIKHIPLLRIYQKFEENEVEWAVEAESR